ncbi:MAG: SGNH/GDSL hydrolase family protein [Eubacteriales bacterium]|nr:SGNH/GDSL hydrolase family protein [Eubacteriales bacterium]
MRIEDYYFEENEKPLDKVPEDGGFTAIFRRIAVIGDSLSSGEFEAVISDTEREYHDCYEHSWGQYIGRTIGAEILNFSRGGMTAREYCQTFAKENGFWDKDKAADAYIIALGINDKANYNHDIGSTDDIKDDWRENGDTFIGNYARIIQRYKEISPKAKFFIVIPPRGIPYSDEPANTRMKALIKSLHVIEEFFPDVYAIDLHTYAPEYDQRFMDAFFMGGHMSAQGYLITAKMIMAYIDFIIRKNSADFKEAGFIRTPWKYDMRNM